ncbi:beta strand repeat-containing protein [Nitratidesulfovibrio sp. 1201_IL3209]|uniref:beta strand repeat-containing protein n=1 Tax=Nitratidesulfovibrio sp. 1201_IL3209 TaxID=3084053 RepID=UPI002FD9DBBF
MDLFGGQAADGGKYGAYGMAAAWGGATNRITNVEDVQITADASGSANGYAYGMYTRDGWGASVQNIIESDSAFTVDITAKAGDAGKAFAMFSNWGGANIIQGGSQAGDVRGDAVTLTGDLFAQGGYNKIATGAGNDTVTIHGNIVAGDNIIETGKGDDTVSIHGNVAGQQGINTGEGNDTVYIDGNMAGHNQLTINTGSGNDRVTITGQMRAEGANASNTVRTGAGDDTVTVDGLHATSGGRNGIDTGSGNDAVTINGSVHADGGHNTIVAGDGHGTATVDVNGSVTALSGGTSSIHAHSDTEARVTITSAASGTAYGVRASAGNTEVAADGGTVNITVDSEGGRSYGLYANSAGKNKVSADDGITVTTTAATTAMGVAAWGADNELRSAQGDIVINTGGENRAADADTSWGVYAQGVGNTLGNNTLDAAGDIEVRSSGVSSANGVTSFGEQSGAAGSARGENILTAGGDIIVDTHAANGYASALVAEGYNSLGASGRASNTLTAGGAIDLDVAARTTAYGISANNGGQNMLYSADGGISLDVRSETANAEGLYASFNNSATTMMAGRGDVTVDVRGVTGAAGLYASLSGVNTLVAADGDMRVSAAASQANKNAASLNSPSAHVNLSNQMSATALYANAAGTNDLSASGSLEIHASATGSSTAAGAAGDVGGSAVAMFALGSGEMGGTNHVAADSVKIGAVADTAEGATVDSGNAYGMLSYVYYASSTAAQSTNTVEIASAADVSVHSSDGSAYGMYAVNESTAGGTARSANVISGAGAEQGVTVRIDVAAGEGKDAYAMFANGRGASNTITGSAHDDVVTITGGMHVVNGGSNRIDGGGGDDTISVTGSFSSQGGGNNVIDGGAGDDTIILNGAVGSGSLTLHGGAGHDTLVLHADSYAAFEEFYSDWLLGTFGSMSIEAVRVVMHGASQEDIDALHALFGNSVFDGAAISYEVADGVVEHGAAAFAALFGVDAESSGHAGYDADNDQGASHHGASRALMAPEAHDDAPADGQHEVFAADGGTLDFDRLAGLPGQSVAPAGHDDPHGGSGELLSAADLLDFGDAGDIPLPGLSADDAMLFSAAGSRSGDWHGPAGMTVGTFDAGVSGGYESDVQLLVHQVVSATSA